MSAAVDGTVRIRDVIDPRRDRRMNELAEKFVLDEPRNAKFYRDVVRRGLGDGYAVVSALICGDEVVATTLGLRHGAQYSLLRNTNAGGQWSNCSPGQLCIERTMAALHRHGVRHSDLSLGNRGYKRWFGASWPWLTDGRIALSWRGMPHVLRARTVRELNQRHPRAFAAAKRLWVRWSAPLRPPFYTHRCFFFDRPRFADVVASDATPIERAPFSTSFRFSVNSVRPGWAALSLFILRMSLERRQWVKMRNTHPE